MTVADTVAATFLRLEHSLREAREAQWTTGHSPAPREDTTERAKGQVNDPTFTAFSDTRRQAVRAAYVEAEAEHTAIMRTMRAAAAHLEAALAAD